MNFSFGKTRFAKVNLFIFPHQKTAEFFYQQNYQQANPLISFDLIIFAAQTETKGRYIAFLFMEAVQIAFDWRIA